MSKTLKIENRDNFWEDQHMENSKQHALCVRTPGLKHVSTMQKNEHHNNRWKTRMKRCVKNTGKNISVEFNGKQYVHMCQKYGKYLTSQ